MSITQPFLLIRSSRARKALMVVALLVVALAAVVVRPLAARAAGTAGFFTATSGRLLDTRSSGGAYVGNTWHTIYPNGQFGIPTTGVTALSVTFTTTGSTAGGFLTALPGSATQQIVTSQLNWNSGDIISNSAVVGTDDNGAIQIYVKTTTQLIVDVQGYFSSSSSGTSSGGFTPLPNYGARIFDSRASGVKTGHLNAGQTYSVSVGAQNSGVPSSATSVFANITVVSYDTHSSYVTAWPAGAPQPTTSLDYAGNEITALGGTVAVNSSGQFSLFVGASAVNPIDVFIDVQGYYTSSSTPGSFTPQTARVYDSRSTSAQVQPNSVTKVQIANLGGIPAATSGGTAAEPVNVEAVSHNSTDNGYLRLWGTNQQEPTNSDLNLDPGATRSNLATVVPGSDNSIYVRYAGSSSSAAIDVVLDVEGWYVSSSLASVPGPPQSVTATASDSSATVSFSPPTSDGGAPVTSYSVTASPGGEIVSSTGSPIVVTGLNNGTTYTFTVTATNGAGTGAASAVSGAVTPKAVANAPGAPTGVAAVSNTVTTATVTFSAPRNTGGSAITGYTVKASPGPAFATGSGSPITVTGLTTHATYTFTVTATNSAGTGPASVPSNRVTVGGSGGSGSQVSCYDTSNHCWGVDILGRQGQSDLDGVRDNLGGGHYPDFIGRYLTHGAPGFALTKDEVNLYRTNHVAIELLADETGGCPDDATGTTEADDAASAAHSLGLDSGGTVAIFLDEDESTATKTASCERRYADELTSKGYLAGFYLNPGDASGTAFCNAYDDNNVANSIVFSDQMELDNYNYHRTGSPSFDPEKPNCGSGVATYGWQYQQSSANGTGYDSDEVAPDRTTALWAP